MPVIRSYANGAVAEATLPDACFGERGRPAVLRHAVLLYEANLRQGTVNTLSRRFVNGSSKKFLRQKGSGRARHGDRKAPLFRGGGVAHGPHPRDFRQGMPRKALRRALQVALAWKLRDGEVLRWEGTPVVEPSSRSIVRGLKALGIAPNALFVGPGPVGRALLLSVRNLPRVSVRSAAEVTAYDVAAHESLILLDGALEALQKRLGQDGSGIDAPDAAGEA